MELPEVEILRRDLEKDVVGKRIKSVDVRPQRNAMRAIRRHAKRKDFIDRLQGKKITKVDRRGKFLLMHLDGGEVLVVHFGMSGQFVRATKRQTPTQHTHVVVEFTQGGDLRFVDPRTFGEMFVTTAGDNGKVKELDHMGPDALSFGEVFVAEPEELAGLEEFAQMGMDPLEDNVPWQFFSQELSRRSTKLKSLLMDQRFVSGIGNIYSDEVLFSAGLKYDHMSGELSSQEVRRLYRALREVLQDAIRFRGTTLGDEAYVDLFGKPGEFQAELKVYGRRGLPCRRCRTPIVSTRFQGRTTYYCPKCQS
jgi:formamidopyrimidine-DNA glycosylase